MVCVSYQVGAWFTELNLHYSTLERKEVSLQTAASFLEMNECVQLVFVLP
jgi:hypothetical protein